MPTHDSIDRFKRIPLWISPPGTQVICFHHNNVPSKEKLRMLGWVEVNRCVSSQQLVSINSGSLYAKYMHYSLKNITV